jgi:hypothetical protein
LRCSSQIERTGFLSKAADSLKMSYARAWHLLDAPSPEWDGQLSTPGGPMIFPLPSVQPVK